MTDEVGDKGLKKDAIGFLDGLVIGNLVDGAGTRWPRCWRSWSSAWGCRRRR
jgi:hypothetical protein